MLSFIQSKTLRKTIIDSIEYILFIFRETNKKNITPIYKEETYRVIVLYSVAIIEAILLHILEIRGDEITTLVYKNPSKISEKIKHQDYPYGNVVTAIQCKEKKLNQQIGVRDLVTFMKKNKFMSDETAHDIIELNNIRNTFHLNKKRAKINLEVQKVELSLSLLHKIIKGAPKAIAK